VEIKGWVYLKRDGTWPRSQSGDQVIRYNCVYTKLSVVSKKRERARELINSLKQRDIDLLNRQTIEHRRTLTEAKESECDKEALFSDMHKEIKQQRPCG